MYTWIIEEKLAQAPLPDRSVLEQIARTFTGVVVLPTPHELPQSYIDYLKNLELDVLYIPTPDHYPVELLDLLRASMFIEKHVSKGGAVLVHCYGGIGRSGQVTVGYLVYKGYGVYQALSYVRTRVPGSVENQWQLQLLEDYYTLVNNVNVPLLSKFAEAVDSLSDVDKTSYKHLSKVMQFAIELYNELGLSSVDIKRVLHTSMLHVHREDLLKFLEKKLNLVVESNDVIEFSHALDYNMDSRVVVLYVRTMGKPEIVLLCSEPCRDVVSNAKNSMERLTTMLNVEPELNWDTYLNYI